MKEEQLKKIIQKSAIETSDDFLNNLMHSIEAKQKMRQPSFWWSFKTVLMICMLLVMVISFLLFKDVTFGVATNIPKTPVFVIITAALLFGINHIMRLNENQKKSIG